LEPGGCLKEGRSPQKTGQVTYISRQDLMLCKIYPFCFSKKSCCSHIKNLNLEKNSKNSKKKKLPPSSLRLSDGVCPWLPTFRQTPHSGNNMALS
jgi:hypothetical protein